MGGGSKKQTVGYWYKLLYHAGLSKGPIDAFLEFRGGDRPAWQGELTASGTINIDKPKLWGGTEEQGGIVSDVDLMFGEATQAPNAYLLANLGDQVPAWRGLATLVFKGGKYGAMNPYPQKASYKIRKIKQGWDGACWYPETAEIIMGGVSNVELGPTSTGWRHLIVPLGDAADYSAADFDDSAWDVGQMPYASADGQPYAAANGFPPEMATYWPLNTELWARKTVMLSGSGITSLTLTIFIDNFAEAWVNGTQVLAEIDTTAGAATFTVSADLLVEGGNTFVLHGTDDLSTSSGDYTYMAWKLVAGGYSLIAANPAHVLYFARSNSDLGREPTANINDASLTAAADTLYAEGFGICTTRDPTAESVEEFEQRISKLIDGAFSRDPITGQWHLDLARGDYVLADLPILTDDDILEFKELPSTLDNAVNSVSVKYFDPEKKETITTPPVQARALIAQFGTIHQTIDYPEIPTADLAVRVALRELRATATPTRALELVCTRKPGAWRVNTYFRLQAPKRGIADMVCIVGEKQSGNLKSGAIRLKATQDIYSMPATAFVDIEPGVDTAPPQTPLPIAAQAAFEAPYAEVVTALPRAELAVLPADVGYLLTVAADPARSTRYTVMVDAGAGYVETATGDWAPTATVVEASGYDDIAFTLASGSRLDEVVVGSAALWGPEIVRVDTLDVVTGALTLGRGCADTVPVPHAAGERIWFYGDSAASDETEYTDGETIDVKLLTNTASRQLDLALATAIPVTFDARLMRPYPPGKLRINGTSYPDYIEGAYSLSWAHRDRLAQADQLIDTEMASIGPETGTTYTLRLYGETGTLLRTETGLTGTSYAWTAEQADSGLTVPGSEGGADYDTVVAASAPTARWKMDETSGTTMLDSVGGYNGTYFNGVLIGQPPLVADAGKSAKFDGVNDYATVPDNAALRPGTGEYAIEMTEKFTGTGLGVLFAKFVNSGDFPGVLVFVNHPAAGRIQLRDKNVSGYWVSSVTTGLNDGVDRHYVFQRRQVSAGVWKLEMYINGSLDAATTLTAVENLNSTDLIYVGSRSGIQLINGTTDDVIYYVGSALTPEEVQSHYLASVGLSALPRLNNRIRCELESVRDGLVSGQRHDVTVIRVGYGYSYGYSYGGL